MKSILVVHNYYQQPGGEDQVFAAETRLLDAHGHRVLRYTTHNDLVRDMNPLALAWRTIWNGRVYRELRELLQEERPQVVHFHNTFPLISPAAYYAAKAEGVPVVQRLPNYRLLCPNALLLRHGKVCETCLGKIIAWPSLIHRCYRQSLRATGATAAMLAFHRAIRTWRRKVDVYIALTEFGRDKFIQGGLPVSKVVVKPNFLLHDPGRGDGHGKYALFVGRLSAEKGLNTLLAAWERLGGDVPLKIAGDGPLVSKVTEAARRLPGVEWLGRVSNDNVLALMKDALFLVFPSTWYEGFPNVIVEAYAVGLPVIASNIGSMSSLIEDGRTGLHFRPGDPDDLAGQVEWALTHPGEMSRMGREARQEFEQKYTAERNHEMLMGIYQRAIGRGE